MSEEEEIVAKLDEHEALENRLEKEFPNYALVYLLREQIENLECCKGHMAKILDTCSNAPIRSFLPELKEFKYHFSSYVGILYTIFDSYLNSVDRYAKTNKDVFKKLHTEYSKNPSIAILRKLRNIQVHSRPTFSSGISVSYAVWGAISNKAEFRIDKGEMDQVIKGAETFTSKEFLDAYLDSLKEVIHDPEKGVDIIRYPIQRIIHDSEEKTLEFLQKSIDLYLEVSSEEISKRDEIVDSLEELDKWFVEKGLITPK